MKNIPTLSVIIPVLNEERTVGSIVEVVKSWGKAIDIIVVSDGSTDGTEASLSRFKKDITLVSFSKNLGQGAAVSEGVRLSRGDIIFTIDGDLTSLTHFDLDRLVHAVERGKADMAIGVLRYWKAGGFEPFNDISGTRVFLKKAVEHHLKELQNSRYGITVVLNTLHKNKRVVSVRLPHVFVLGKFEKQSVPDAIKAYIIEARELLASAVKKQTKDIPPGFDRLLAGTMRYLKNALDYFQ